MIRQLVAQTEWDLTPITGIRKQSAWNFPGSFDSYFLFIFSDRFLGHEISQDLYQVLRVAEVEVSDENDRLVDGRRALVFHRWEHLTFH